MRVLSQDQYDQFWRDGVLMVNDAVEPILLDAMKGDFAKWLTESCNHFKPYGKTVNNQPRFDLDPGHSQENPRIRRVNAPIEVSDAFYKAMSDSCMTACVANLIGPNV